MYKLESKVFPKVMFHLQKFSTMSRKEKEGFKKDFHKYVVKNCLKTATILSSNPDSALLTRLQRIASTYA
jgi:hypothetical protein